MNLTIANTVKLSITELFMNLTTANTVDFLLLNY